MENLKIPCIACNSVLWDVIEPYLKDWGYEASHSYDGRWEIYPILVINHCDCFGYYCNVSSSAIVNYDRKLVCNVDEFLSMAAALKGFTYIKKEDMQKEFTLNDLKPGMLIKYRKGDIRLVLSNINNTLFFADDIFASDKIENIYNLDLTHKKNKSFDVVAIYTFVEFDSINSLLKLKNVTCLWQREEKIQITMNEIAEKFNFPVESISIIK